MKFFQNNKGFYRTKFGYPIVLLLLISVAGCSSATQTPPSSTPATPPTSTFTLIPPTLTLTFTPLPTNSPTITLTPAPLSCWPDGGQIIEVDIETEYIKNPFRFLVYLPPCYDQQPERFYPTLYLFHGQTFTHDQWDRLGADDVVDRLVAFGEIEPFIIVMPRYQDWAGPTDNKLDQAVMKDLIPYIESTYRAIPGRDFRAVGGLSKGASWALHLGLTEWESFGIIGLHSLPIFYEDAPSVPAWLEEIPPDMYPRMYLDLSESDLIAITKSTQWFIDLLEEMDIPHEFHIYPGSHNEEYWSQHVEEYIRFYAEEW